MASTIVTITENLVQHPMVVAAITAASSDLTALQSGGVAGRVSTTFLAGATLAVVTATHNGGVIALNHATASAVTLPAATGSGAKFTFVVTVVPSGSHTIAVTTDDTFIGILESVDIDSTNAGLAFPAVAGDNRITLTGDTTGANVVGDRFEIIDLAADVWHVSGYVTATGTVVTPFSTV